MMVIRGFPVVDNFYPWCSCRFTRSLYAVSLKKSGRELGLPTLKNGTRIKINVVWN
jgi:hypothetical protein